MRIIKKLAVFLCLNLVAVLGLEFVLSAPYAFPILYSQCKNGAYDTLIVGHSFGSSGFYPEQIKIDGEDRAFNMCIGGAPLHNIYYEIRDLHETHPLKQVILELYWPYWTTSMYSANYIEFDHQTFKMLSPAVRWEFFREELARENYNRTLFPYKLDKLTAENLKNFPRAAKIKLDPRYWRGSPEILPELNDPERYQYMGDGFFYGLEHQEQLEEGYSFWHFEPEAISDQALEDFDRIVDYCKRSGITLYCVETALLPVRLQNENHGQSHDYFEELCSSRDVRYIDMNYVRYELLPRTYSDYEDTDGHMTGEMAARHSGLLAEILRSEDPDSYFESDYEDVLQGIEAYEASCP